MEAYRTVPVPSGLQLVEPSRTLGGRFHGGVSFHRGGADTESSQKEVTSPVDDAARTRGPEFKPEQSGGLCSGNDSVGKINSRVNLFPALRVICGSPTEGSGCIE